jgi:hypothetical protein
MIQSVPLDFGPKTRALLAYSLGRRNLKNTETTVAP